MDSSSVPELVQTAEPSSTELNGNDSIIEDDGKEKSHSTRDKNHKYEPYSKEIKFKNPADDGDPGLSGSDDCYDNPYEWYNLDEYSPQVEVMSSQAKSCCHLSKLTRKKIVFLVISVGKVSQILKDSSCFNNNHYNFKYLRLLKGILICIIVISLTLTLTNQNQEPSIQNDLINSSFAKITSSYVNDHVLVLKTGIPGVNPFLLDFDGSFYLSYS